MLFWQLLVHSCELLIVAVASSLIFLELASSFTNFVIALVDVVVVIIAKLEHDFGYFLLIDFSSLF